MSFAQPWLFLFLLAIPLFVGFRLLSLRRAQRRSASFIRPEMLARMTPTVSTARRAARFTLVLLAVACLTIAAARPQFGSRVRFVEKRGIDVAVVLDTSESMRADDIKPSRFQAARRSITDLVRRLTGDRVALVGFSGDAFIQSPLTADQDGFRVLMDALDIGAIPLPGTNLERALDQALLALRRGGDKRQGVAIIYTDGENHVGDLEAAAARVKEAGVTVFTVGVGTEAGSPIPIDGAYKKDLSGNVVVSRMDVTALEKLANETGGKFFQLSPSGTEVDEIFGELDRLEKTPVMSEEVEARADRFQYFLAAAFLLLVAESLVGVRRS